MPPSSSPFGLLGLNESDWNWIVLRPSLIGVIVCGIPLSNRWQSVRSGAASGTAPWPGVYTNRRGEQAADLFCGLRTSIRTTPPSDPTNAMPGSTGSKTTACWSGWIPRVNENDGADPTVADMSCQVTSAAETPPFVDLTTARPFERGGAPL